MVDPVGDIQARNRSLQTASRSSRPHTEALNKPPYKGPHWDGRDRCMGQQSVSYASQPALPFTAVFRSRAYFVPPVFVTDRDYGPDRAHGEVSGAVDPRNALPSCLNSQAPSMRLFEGAHRRRQQLKQPQIRHRKVQIALSEIKARRVISPQNPTSTRARRCIFF